MEPTTVKGIRTNDGLVPLLRTWCPCARTRGRTVPSTNNRTTHIRHAPPESAPFRAASRTGVTGSDQETGGLDPGRRPVPDHPVACARRPTR